MTHTFPTRRSSDIHPAMSVELQPDNYQHRTLATDKLVPVCQAIAQGKPRYCLEGGHASLPLISYSRGLAMGRIAGDRIETMPYPLVTSMRCDSLDAMLGTVSNGQIGRASCRERVCQYV